LYLRPERNVLAISLEILVINHENPHHGLAVSIFSTAPRRRLGAAPEA